MSNPKKSADPQRVNPAIENIVNAFREPATVPGPRKGKSPKRVPLMHELFVLLKYWIRLHIEVVLFCYTHEHCCSSCDSRRWYANRRIDAICEMFSQDVRDLVCKRAVADVEQEYATFFYQAMKEGRTLLRDEYGMPLPEEQQTAGTADACKNAGERPAESTELKNEEASVSSDDEESFVDEDIPF